MEKPEDERPFNTTRIYNGVPLLIVKSSKDIPAHLMACAEAASHPVMDAINGTGITGVTSGSVISFKGRPVYINKDTVRLRMGMSPCVFAEVDMFMIAKCPNPDAALMAVMEEMSNRYDAEVAKSRSPKVFQSDSSKLQPIISPIRFGREYTEAMNLQRQRLRLVDALRRVYKYKARRKLSDFVHESEAGAS